MLLTASLLFYAWGEPVFVLVMLFVSFSVYLGTLAFNAAKNDILKKTLFALTILAALAGLLCTLSTPPFLSTRFCRC